MVRRVVWTPLAQKNRKEILKYWIEHNQSNRYSKKLNHLFKAAVKLLTKYPNIGKTTNIPGVKVKVIRDYLLFYKFNDSTLFILTVWDARQNPDKLRLK